MPRKVSAVAAAAAVAERNDGLAFEHYCVRHHRAKYGHTVWHASVVPEEELFAAGVFHDYNSRRMLRNANLRDSRTRGGITSPYVDDGIDFLVKKPDEDPSKRAAYYPGQAKNYAKKPVCASDLAGFYRNMQIMRSPGYLYTTTRLEIRLREDLMKYPDLYTHERLDFDPTAFALTQAISHSDETTYGLRGYQTDAVSAILDRLAQDEQTKMILHVGCGLGKTLIAGRVFAEIKNKRKPYIYVCIAPLRVSVTNLKDRLSPFFTAIASSSSAPQFRTLLVNSDSGGTTDPVHIGNVLKTREPIVIFATYESFFGLLTEEFGEYFTDEDAFLLVDEMHNLTKAQCRVVNEYQTALLMSATVPEQLKEILDATEAYRYTMADGIKNGFLCDYEVYLPLVKRAPTPTATPTDSEAATPTTSAGSAEPDDDDEDASDGDPDDEDDGNGDGDGDAEDDGRERTAVDMEFPAGFPADDVTAKALFLCTGMLQTGSRRCIVYLRSTDECVQFNRMLRRVSEEYHGLRLWSAQMDYTVGSARRSEILRDFQADSEEHDLFVIASVRILDEAVDIPRCDSEFITYVGDRASDIRTVQRLQRGGRLDPANPSKRNNLFMWTEEWSRAVNSLTLMRQEDALFHKKLRTLSACYDRLGDPAVQREMRARAEELQAYAEVRCLTLKEMWMKRAKDFRAMRERLGRDPKTTSSDPEERRQAIWLVNQRQLKKNNKLPAERVAILEAISWWSWVAHDYGNAVAKFRAMRERLGRDPTILSSDAEERQQARWLVNQRQLKKNNDLPAERVAILEDISWWSWAAHDYGDAVAEFCAMRERLGRNPSSTSSNAEERRQAKWLSHQRQSKRNGALPADRIAMLQAIPNWSWGNPRKPRKNAT
jgi:superfamily II DNA or RNA helicase